MFKAQTKIFCFSPLTTVELCISKELNEMIAVSWPYMISFGLSTASASLIVHIEQHNIYIYIPWRCVTISRKVAESRSIYSVLKGLLSSV